MRKLTDRNKQILADAEAGLSYNAIGEKYRISPVRASRIARSMGFGYRIETKPGWTEKKREAQENTIKEKEEAKKWTYPREAMLVAQAIYTAGEWITQKDICKLTHLPVSSVDKNLKYCLKKNWIATESYSNMDTGSTIRYFAPCHSNYNLTWEDLITQIEPVPYDEIDMTVQLFGEEYERYLEIAKTKWETYEQQDLTDLFKDYNDDYASN